MALLFSASFPRFIIRSARPGTSAVPLLRKFFARKTFTPRTKRTQGTKRRECFCSDGHWFWAAGGNHELGLGDRLDLFECGVRGELAEDDAFGSDIDESKFGDDVIDDFDAGEREGALFQNFWLVVARGVLHGDEDALGAGYEVHRAAHSF